jgi:hypothetical protein
LEKKFINNLSNEDLQIANQIIVRICLKLQKFIDEFENFEKNPKKYTPKLNKVFYKLMISENLYNTDSGDALNPTKIKKDMLNNLNVGIDYNNYEFQDKLADSIYSNKNINESLLSKVLSELSDKNILTHTMKTKKDLSKLDRKERKKYDVDGRISFYRIAPSIEKIKKIMANPEAVRFINNSLKQTKIFKIFLKLSFKSYIYLLNSADEKSNQLIKGFGYSIAKNYENNFSDNYDSFIKDIKDAKLQNNEIEYIVESLSNEIVKSNVNSLPIALFFPYSLSEEEI